MLHANHPGVVAMKSTARSHFWWPRLDADIEATAAACETCQQHHRAKSTVPTPDWSPATRPWETVHIDFAGPIDGISYRIVVDAYSKWLEVKPMHSTTSTRIIDALRSTFATFGVPRILFSDNAPNFVSNEMDEFVTRNGIKHYTSAPYHLATNGQAERMVGETKKALLKLKEGTIQCRIARFLFRQHTTVSTSTGKTPAEAMFGRRIATPLDLMNQSSSTSEDREAPTDGVTADYSAGQTVYVRNFGGRPAWVTAVIMKPLGIRSFQTRTEDGKLQRRHVDHIRPRRSHLETLEGKEEASPFLIYPATEDIDESQMTQPENRCTGNNNADVQDRGTMDNNAEVQDRDTVDDNADVQADPGSRTTRGGSQIKQPAHFKDYVLGALLFGSPVYLPIRTREEK
ncbi:uncharacterized protein ISCGN_001938 [Ixodes scapularis]